MGEHYQRAIDAKASGKPVVYVTAMFPVELVKAFEPDVATVYPENHAAMLISAGRKERLAEELAGVAQNDVALDPMECSYRLVNMGYLLNDESVNIPSSVPELPTPDIALACDNQCRIVSEWFESLGRMYDIPTYSLNVGDSYDGEVSNERIKFVRSQLDEVIRILVEKTGKALDQDKLLDIAIKSNEATNLWRSFLEFGKHHPSPMTVWDGFYHLALVVSERGTDEAVDYYQQLVSETRKQAMSCVSAVGEEKHRLLWDNLPPWFSFGRLKHQFAEKGVAVVGSTYLDVWKKELEVFNFDSLMNSLAEVYATMYTNLTMNQRVELWSDMVSQYDAEGVLWHNNLSCHTFSREQGLIAKALSERFPDFKNIRFDGCMGLSDRFRREPIDNALDAYFS